MAKKLKKEEMTPEQLKWDNYIDKLVDIIDEKIPLHQVTILTGKNGSGKSMIRKLLPSILRHKEELKEGFYINSTSMDERAGIDPGKMMVFSRDLEWEPTSVNTLHSVLGILKAEKEVKKPFMVLDEIELGLGEELQAGLALEINKLIDHALEYGLGILVITHSRTIVRNMRHDNFVNLEDMTEEEWLNREIVPRTIEDLTEESNALYRAFDNRLITNR